MASSTVREKFAPATRLGSHTNGPKNNPVEKHPDGDHYPSNRYERLKTTFIELRDEDNLRLFNVKKALLQLQCNHISRSNRLVKRLSRNSFLSKLTWSDSISDERRRFMPLQVLQ
jgi:hypothetical protein